MSTTISRTDRLKAVARNSPRKPMHNVTLNSGMVANGSELPKHGHARPGQEVCFRRWGRSRHVMMNTGACKAWRREGGRHQWKK